jgi:hypothetical protein
MGFKKELLELISMNIFMELGERIKRDDVDT